MSNHPRIMLASLATLVALAGCAAPEPTSSEGRQEGDWTVTPNGSAGLATIHIDPPTGFEGAVTTGGPDARWRFTWNQTELVLGQDTSVAPGTYELLASLHTVAGNAPWDMVTHRLATLTVRAGERAVGTFGAVQIANLTFDRLASADLCTMSTLVEPEVFRTDTPGYPHGYLAGRFSSSNGVLYTPDQSGLERPVPKAAPWRYGTTTPLPAGSYRLSFSAPVGDRPFVVETGKVVAIDGAATGNGPVSRLRFVRDTPAAMPDAVGLSAHVSCAMTDFDKSLSPAQRDAWGLRFSHEAPADHDFTFYTGARSSSCAAWVGLSAVEGFTVSPGADLSLHFGRIEVGNVVLADATPPQTVKGWYEVQVAQANGQWSSPLGSSVGGGTFYKTFWTGRGVDVLAGRRYRVTVHYDDQAGVARINTYEAQL